MSKLLRPLQRGTPGAIVLGVVTTAVFIYFYFVSETRDALFYVLILIGLGSTAYDVFKYRKLAAQNGTSLIGD